MNVTRATTGADKQRSYNGDYQTIGKIAETKVLDFLKQRPEVIGVLDYRDLRPIQEADVDCAIKTADGLVTLAEIKSDYHLGVSGNVLFEVLRINHTCEPSHALTLGWAGRSPAAYFLYYAPQLNSIYACKSAMLRKAFQAYTKESRGKMQVRIVETDAIKTTINVLIPWRFCEHIFTIYELAARDV